MKDFIIYIFLKLNFINNELYEGNIQFEDINQGNLRLCFYLMISWMGLVLAYLFTMYSFKLDSSLGYHKWFASSGAILVMTALIVEYLSGQTSTIFLTTLHMDDTFQTFKRIFRNIGFITAVLGTLIWAYGHMWRGWS